MSLLRFRRTHPDQSIPLLQGLDHDLDLCNLNITDGHHLAVHVDGHDVGVIGLHVERDPRSFEEGGAKLVPEGDSENLGTANGELGRVPGEGVVADCHLQCGGKG